MLRYSVTLGLLAILALGLSSAHLASASYCGDGNVDVGEECDDGNRYNGDGCSGNCVVELWWNCENAPFGTVCQPAERDRCTTSSTGEESNLDVDGDGNADIFAGSGHQKWQDCTCGEGQVKSFLYNPDGCALCVCQLPEVCSDGNIVGEDRNCRCLPGCDECDYRNGIPTTCQRCSAGKFLSEGNCLNYCSAEYTTDAASADPTDGDYNRCVLPTVFGIPALKVGGFVLGDFFTGEDTHLGFTAAPDTTTESIIGGSGAAVTGLSASVMAAIAIACFAVAVIALAGMGYFVKKTVLLRQANANLKHDTEAL